MVYKLYGKVGTAYVCEQLANPNNHIICNIDGNDIYLSNNQYIFNFQKSPYYKIANLFDEINKDKKIIFLYSNLCYETLKDFIDFLETLKHDFVIFIKE